MNLEYCLSQYLCHRIYLVEILILLSIWHWCHSIILNITQILVINLHYMYVDILHLKLSELSEYPHWCMKLVVRHFINGFSGMKNIMMFLGHVSMALRLLNQCTSFSYVVYKNVVRCRIQFGSIECVNELLKLMDHWMSCCLLF